MRKVKDIMGDLQKEYPSDLAMEWDNPGLQVGDTSREVSRIFVALDATESIIQECIRWNADLLVTHHPLLMSGIKRISNENMAGRRVLQLAENHIAHYAIHTNYDVTAMKELAREALGLRDAVILEETGTNRDGAACGIGSVGLLPEAMTAEECCRYVKQTFGLSSVRLFGDPGRMVQKLAVSPGSGKSMVRPAILSGADILVTGDIGHHDGIDAVDENLLIIDAGHYGIEHIFIQQMTGYLQKRYPEIQVKAAKKEEPYLVF